LNMVRKLIPFAGQDKPKPRRPVVKGERTLEDLIIEQIVLINKEIAVLNAKKNRLERQVEMLTRRG